MTATALATSLYFDQGHKLTLAQMARMLQGYFPRQFPTRAAALAFINQTVAAHNAGQHGSQ